MEEARAFQDPAEMARKEAERLHKIAFPESYETGEGEPAPAPTETEGTPEETPAPAPESIERKVAPNDGTPAETPAAPETPVTPAPKDEDTPEYWRKRFEVMQGKYNAEVPRMADQIRELSDQLRDFATRQAPAPAAQEQQPPTDAVKTVIGRIAETYGDELANDFLELAQTIASTTAKETVQPMQAELAQVKTTSTKNAQQSFEDALSSRVSNWRQVYDDPQFGRFLSTSVEPMSGLSYESLFTHANQSWDLDRIAYFFTMFNESQEAAASQRTTTPTAPEAPPVTPAPPAHLVTPARRGGGMQTQMENAQGQIYTAKQINDFYKDVLDGKYRGQDEKVRRLKADYAKAAAEGRVVG